MGLCPTAERLQQLTHLKQRKAYWQRTYELEKTRFLFFRKHYPGVSELRQFQLFTDLAESRLRDATDQYASLYADFVKTPTGDLPMDQSKVLDSEQKIVVDHLTDAFRTATETWSELPSDVQDQTDLEDMQTTAILGVLAKLGLTLEVMAHLNKQSVMILPVKHVEHYKGGHYVVLGEGIHTETNEEITIYRNFFSGSWYARPAAMFHEFVEALGRKRFVPKGMAHLLNGKK